jgi:hypothetical protein
MLTMEETEADFAGRHVYAELDGGKKSRKVSVLRGSYLTGDFHNSRIAVPVPTICDGAFPKASITASMSPGVSGSAMSNDRVVSIGNRLSRRSFRRVG